MILVTGATGELGKATIDFLLKKVPADRIIGFAKASEKADALEEKGITVKRGDYWDYPSLLSAFTGVEKILMVSAVAFTDRTAQHINIINAAKESGVKHIIFTSIQRQEPIRYMTPWVTESNLATENYLKDSGLNYTIVKNNSYTEGIPLFLGDDVLETGVQATSGEGKIAFATRMNMAEGYATILLSDDHINKEYTFCGTRAYSFADIAGIIAEVTQQHVPYKSIPAEDYISKMMTAGFPDFVAAFFTQWMTAYAFGELAATDSTLEDLLGHELTSVEEYLKSVYARKEA